MTYRNFARRLDGRRAHSPGNCGEHRGTVPALAPHGKVYPHGSDTPTQSKDCPPARALTRPHAVKRVGHRRANALTVRRFS
jgi:hypothetical protein